MAGSIASSPFESRSFLHRTDRGELRLSVPGPTVFVFEYKGYSDEGFVDFIERVWNEAFADQSKKIQVFVDTESQTGHASGFRTRLMEWSKRMVSRTDVYFLLVRSRWIAIGIAIVKATVGLPAAHAEVTTNGPLYRQKLEEAVQRSFAQDAHERPPTSPDQTSLDGRRR